MWALPEQFQNVYLLSSMYSKKSLERAISKLQGFIFEKVSKGETYISRILWEVFGNTLTIYDIDLDLNNKTFNWSIEYKDSRRKIYIQLDFSDTLEEEDPLTATVFAYNGKEQVFILRNFELKVFKHTMEKLLKILKK